MPNKTVIVTGASGFIGGAICLTFKEAGYKVLGIDYRKNYMTSVCDFFIHDDVKNFIPRERFNRHYITDSLDPCAFIHCAGTSLVGPSMVNPSDYYYNNVGVSALALSYLSELAPHMRFMFSSSASVYKTNNDPLKEEDSKQPISPYAKSKYMVEEIILDHAKAYGLEYTIFRYFNACGAMGSDHGQKPGASHIFPRLFESALNDQPFVLNGVDYKTKDGTCIRDYVHVRDIARAHLLAVENNCTGTYNLGSNTGYSNLEIIRAVEKALNKKIKLEIGKRREGDSDCLIADTSKANDQLPWTSYSELPIIIDDLISWYNSDNYKRL